MSKLKMRKKVFVRLWTHFLLITFLSMCITVSITMTLTFIASKFHKFNHEKINIIVAILPILLLTLILSAFFTCLFSVVLKRFLTPINKLIKATKEVAKGDFSIRLNETKKHSEICDMNIAFNKMVKELSGIETLRNDFIVNVSHEFKTPIAAIEGYATLLQDPTLSESEKMEYTKIILDSAKQLSSLSGNILKLSKLETQEIQPEMKYFYLDEQIRQCLLMLENKWNEKNIFIDMNMDTTYYYGCEDLLMQVWLNIFSNSIKFTPQDGIITTKLKSDDKNIYVSISDNGIGMSKEVQERIFEKFYQGDKSRNFEGNGLGLTLVKRIIDLCQGSIEVESGINKGTTFNITLPIN